MIRLIREFGVGLIPLLGLIGLFGGASSLVWYARLSTDDKQRADKIAEDYANELYEKARAHLTQSEAHHVNTLTKRHFVI